MENNFIKLMEEISKTIPNNPVKKLYDTTTSIIYWDIFATEQNSLIGLA